MTPRYKIIGPQHHSLALPDPDHQRPPEPEPPAAPARAIIAEPPVVPVEVEPVLDPVGRVIEVDGRVLSERLMFMYGRKLSTFGEIAEEFAASELWLEVVIRENPWLEEARQAGVMAADRDRVIRSERGLDKLIDGHVLVKQKLSKLTGEPVDVREEVSPSGAVIGRVLQSREKKRYGKEATSININISSEVFDAARARAQRAGPALTEITVAPQETR